MTGECGGQVGGTREWLEQPEPSESEAAMADSGDLRRDWATPEANEERGGAWEMREGSGTPYIATGKALERTSKLEQCSNVGQWLGVARTWRLRIIYGESR